MDRTNISNAVSIPGNEVYKRGPVVMLGECLYVKVRYGGKKVCRRQNAKGKSGVVATQ